MVLRALKESLCISSHDFFKLIEGLEAAIDQKLLTDAAGGTC